MAHTRRPSDGYLGSLYSRLLHDIGVPLETAWHHCAVETYGVNHGCGDPCVDDRPGAYDVVAESVLVAALKRRGWRARDAHRVVAYNERAYRYGQEDGWIRREFRRRHRHDANRLVRQGREADIARTRGTGGRFTW